MQYENFDLELFDYRAVADGAQFRVRVAASPAGEQKLADAEQVTLAAAVRERLPRLERRKLGWPELVALGTDLAAALLPPQARALLTRSLDRLADDMGLRIRLKLDTFALADLPWEYAYLAPPSAVEPPPSDGFLVLNRRISLVRYEVLGQSPGTLEPVGDGPLRLVALLTNPNDPLYQPLALDAERRHIEQALAQIGSIRPEFYPQATVAVLEDALAQAAHIFHFAGHGAFEQALAQGNGPQGSAGYLVLLDDEQRAVLFSADRLALNLSGRGVRLAVLGACEGGRRDQINPWTGVVPALTRSGIPAVLGMQYTIRDTSALEFSRRFYRALAAGQPVDAAVADGRLAIFNRSGDDERDWGVPVLYLRAEESVLFPRLTVLAAPNTWDEARSRAQEQARRFLQEAQGTPERPGLFMPAVYVPRAAEQDLARLLTSDAAAAIVVGDSGMGKSSLVCHWADELLSAGHLVLIYHCGRLLGTDIERELARDLALGETAAVLPALERLGQLATQQGRQCVLIFDALNEFRSDEQAGPAALLKALNALIERLPAGVRLVLSCNTATWSQLDRQGGTALVGLRYFQPGADERLIRLDLLTADEFAAAYERYRTAFGLRTPLSVLSSALRERLRKPLLLRILAESYRGGDVPAGAAGLALRIFQRYYDERVRQRRELLFVDGLAAAMLRERRSVLRVDDLARDPQLSPEILATDPDSSYGRLLDSGILTETSGDLLQGDTVSFSYTQIAAYVLALHLLRHGGAEQSMRATLITLVRQVGTFPLAWDVARTLLLIRKPPEILAALATATNVELRELAVESLVEIHADAPETALGLLQQLLQLPSEEARRTALKAAYAIGPGARQLFLWAAAKGSPEVRQATKYTLYLIWRSDPEFTFGLLTELVARMGLGALLDLRNLVEFVVDLSVTIYINHCDRRELVDQITVLHYEMYRNKLHLNLLNTGLLGPAFERLIFQAIATAFAQPTLEALLLDDVDPAAQFFQLPAADRARLRRMAALVDPATDLAPARDELAAMLGSNVVLYRLVAAFVLAIHSCHSFETTAPLVRSLFDSQGATGRVWVLLSFTVLLPDVPTEWIGVLEDLTRRLVTDNAAIFYGDEPSLLGQLDIVLLPLGLAYGKRGAGMPVFEELLRDGVRRGDWRQVQRCIAGLGAVGFYYPQPVFSTLRAALPDLHAPQLADVLTRLLSTIRVLDLDAVDIFLGQIGADEAFQRRVAAAADLVLVQRYISWLGLYNNAVHSSLFYPPMRQQLTIAALHLLAEVDTPEGFIARFTIAAFRAARAADFRFTEWARLE